MRSVFCELPALGLEFEMLGNERPIEGLRPAGNEVVFFDPSLIIVVMGRELDGGEVLDIVM